MLYLGQNINTGAALGLWLTEFWNRSLKHVWSLDGTAPGPGPVLTPDLVATDGRLAPDPGVRYVLAERGVDVDGELVARPPKSGRWFVYKLERPAPSRRTPRPASSRTVGWAPRAPTTSTRRRAARAETWSSGSAVRAWGVARTSPAAC